SGLPDGLGVGPTGLISGVIDRSAARPSPYSVTVEVEDGTGESASVNFAWTVGLGSNQAPALEDPADQTGAAGEDVYLALWAEDPDGDVLTFSASGLPDGLYLDAFSGEISGTLADGAASTLAHSVTVVVGDGHTASTQSFLWNVGYVWLDTPGD